MREKVHWYRTVCWIWNHDQNLTFQKRTELKSLLNMTEGTLNLQCEVLHSQDWLLLLCFTCYHRHDQIKAKGQRTLFYQWNVSLAFVYSVFEVIKFILWRRPKTIWCVTIILREDYLKRIIMPQTFSDLGYTTNSLYERRLLMEGN